MGYDVSRDELRVAFSVRPGNESQIFLAAADRSSSPRLVVRAGDQPSLATGQLFFRQVDGNANYLARVQEDGSRLTRILETKITDLGECFSGRRMGDCIRHRGGTGSLPGGTAALRTTEGLHRSLL